MKIAHTLGLLSSPCLSRIVSQGSWPGCLLKNLKFFFEKTGNAAILITSAHAFFFTHKNVLMSRSDSFMATNRSDF
jgi:hypothetical protein